MSVPSVTCGSGTNNWTGSAGDNQWTTAKNWSTGAVPVSTDNVCIASTFTGTITIGSLAAANQTIASLNVGAQLSETGGPLTISGTATFAANLVVSGVLTLNGTSSMTTLQQTAGTLSGSGALTVSGLLTWSGGTESGSGVTNANGGMTISGAPFLDTRTINNSGTATWNGSTFFMLNTAVFNNKSGATWNHQNDTQIQWDGGTPTFSSAGTFEKTGGTSTTGGGVGSSIVFNNTGSVQANSGILFVSDNGSCTDLRGIVECGVGCHAAIGKRRHGGGVERFDQRGGNGDLSVGHRELHRNLQRDGRDTGDERYCQFHLTSCRHQRGPAQSQRRHVDLLDRESHYDERFDPKRGDADGN